MRPASTAAWLTIAELVRSEAAAGNDTREQTLSLRRLEELLQYQSMRSYISLL